MTERGMLPTFRLSTTGLLEHTKLGSGAYLAGKDYIIGDVESLTDHHVLVTPFVPSNSEDSKSNTNSSDNTPTVVRHEYRSLRVIDLNAGRVSHVLSAHASANYCPRIERQHCVESRNLIFSTDNDGISMIFDLRTSSPAFILHHAIPNSAMYSLTPQPCGILGIPTSTAAVAVTWYNDLLQGWDLRRPASHAWTLSTGNLQVRNVAWHASTTSLVVATNNTHKVTFGRCGSYQYGDQYDSEYGDQSWKWPKQASRDAHFFPQAEYDLSHEIENGQSAVLQYSFESSSAM